MRDAQQPAEYYADGGVVLAVADNALSAKQKAAFILAGQTGRTVIFWFLAYKITGGFTL